MSLKSVPQTKNKQSILVKIFPEYALISQKRNDYARLKNHYNYYLPKESLSLLQAALSYNQSNDYFIEYFPLLSGNTVCN